MDKLYNHLEHDKKWYTYWAENNIFAAKIKQDQKPFVAILPPPNITGTLHMGHALNVVLQDTILRFKKLQGYNTLWIPGVDHGGIATQNVIEKTLKKSNQSIYSLGKDEFFNRMQEWKFNITNQILNQLKQLGCCLDWNRTAFTMDKSRSKAVQKAFITLYKKGDIYRGEKIVNWCPKCKTALSDLEVEYENEVSKLWYIKYPVYNSNNVIIIATSRPETIFGDTALAVHPSDHRYKNLVSKMAIVPLLNRKIKIISDYVIDQNFGTGAVKVTPAHDSVDNEIALRHNLDVLNVINSNGKMINVPSEYINLNVSKAREKVIAELKNNGFLFKIDNNYLHSVKQCYRCSTKIELLMSKQWFLNVSNMAKQAIDIVKNQHKITFYPQSWEKSYLSWLNNLRDWCISRQIWWGHRIPIYYCSSGNCKPIADFNVPKECPYCHTKNFSQDVDVLDTWFSSALWPLSVFNWGEDEYNKDLQYFYPTSVLVTGHEILYLWVSRMIQFSLEFTGKIPYKDVVIHGIVRDSNGKKMSKSLGNTINPLDIIQKYGTDSLRFGLMQCATQGRDMQISNDIFLSSRNFINKLWNASRFIIININKFKLNVHLNENIINIDCLELIDKWIILEYRDMVTKVNNSYEYYNIDVVTRYIYNFFWKKYCDWYIEFVKIRLNNNKNKENNQRLLSVMFNILREVLKLISPVIPFITSELLMNINNLIYTKQVHQFNIGSFHIPSKQEADIKNTTAIIQDIITKIRIAKNEMSVPIMAKIKALFYNQNNNYRYLIEKNIEYIKYLTKLCTITFVSTHKELLNVHNSIMVFTRGNCEICLFPESDSNAEYEKERLRLKKKLYIAEKILKNLDLKLKNANFINRAPQIEVTKVKLRFNNLLEEIKTIKVYLNSKKNDT
jgi:valyl-tRNA synthetase